MAVRKKKPFCHLRRPFSAISAILKTQCVPSSLWRRRLFKKKPLVVAGGFNVNRPLGAVRVGRCITQTLVTLAKRLKKSLAREVGRKRSLIEDGSGGV